MPSKRINARRQVAGPDGSHFSIVFPAEGKGSVTPGLEAAAGGEVFQVRDGPGKGRKAGVFFRPIHFWDRVEETSRIGVGRAGKKFFNRGKFDDFPAFGADEMVMMPAQMTVFVSDGLAFKLLFLGKTEVYHPVHAPPNELRFIVMALFTEEAIHLFNGNMFFRFKKGVEDIVHVLNTVLSVDFHKGSEIRPFQVIMIVHGIYLLPDTR